MTANGQRPTDPLWRIVCYSLPAVGLAMLSGPIIVFLPNFYATTLGISLTSVGIIFFVARCWDGASDLFFGFAVDRTKTRWGSRRPWIALATPVLCLATYLACMPPVGVGPAYLMFCLIAVYTAWAAVQIPYTTWGAAISSDYRQRSRIFGLREAGTIIGSLATVMLPFLVTGVASPPVRDILKVVGAGTIVILIISVPLALMFGAKEHEIVRRNDTPLAALVRVRRNIPFLRVLAITLLATTALMIFTAGIIFYLNIVLKLQKSFLPLLLAQQVATMASVPAVIWAASRFGRHRALAAGCTGLAVGFVSLGFAPAGMVTAALLPLVLIGCCAGAMFVLLPSLAADAIDYGALGRESPQTGVYMSIFSLTTKVATALGVGIGLPALQRFGFNPNGALTVEGATALRVVSLHLPGGMLIAAGLIAYTHPINRRRHDTIVRRNTAIAARAEIGKAISNFTAKTSSDRKTVSFDSGSTA